MKISWSSRLAYAIGLLSTDGCLYGDGRSIEFCSKDFEQVQNLLACLKLNKKISTKKSGSNRSSVWRVQISDAHLYTFLISVGLFPRKSKTLESVTIPKKYFCDFLRGHFDGDGTFYSYFDPRWKSSFMWYVELTSASHLHIIWLQKTIIEILHIQGRITKSKNNSAYRLKYAKKESLDLLKRMYYTSKTSHLSRKKKKVDEALKKVGVSI